MNLYHFENVSRETIKGAIKMIKGYAVVRAERKGNGYEFLDTDIGRLFSTKLKAMQEAQRLTAHKKAVNELRKVEGSHERITDVFIVVSFKWETLDDIPQGIINVENWGDEI